MTDEFREGGKRHILEGFVGPAQERKLFLEASEEAEGGMWSEILFRMITLATGWKIGWKRTRQEVWSLVRRLRQ